MSRGLSARGLSAQWGVPREMSAQGGVYPGGSAQWGVCPVGVLPGGVCPGGCIPACTEADTPPTVNRMTDRQVYKHYLSANEVKTMMGIWRGYMRFHLLSGWK